MIDSVAPVVEFRAVRVSFDGDMVLAGVDLRLPAGRTTVLLGPSGAGKTTLVRTLLGLHHPDAGRTEIDGRAIASFDDDELQARRRAMGVLLGGSSVYDASLFGSLTLVENVVYPLRSAGVAAADADAEALRILHDLGVGGRADALPSEVSAGERRRAALARALVGDPCLLVLDDPGPALDLHNRDQVTAVLRRHIARRGTTALVVTHDLDLARAIGDHVAVLLGGRIAATGPTSEVLRGVHDPDEFDARFGVRGLLPSATPEECAAAARRSRRQGLGEAWLLMAVLFVMLGLLGVRSRRGCSRTRPSESRSARCHPDGVRDRRCGAQGLGSTKKSSSGSSPPP